MLQTFSNISSRLERNRCQRSRGFIALLPHGYCMDTQTLKSNYFIFLFFYPNKEAYICVNQSNPI